MSIQEAPTDLDHYRRQKEAIQLELGKTVVNCDGDTGIVIPLKPLYPEIEA